MEEALDAAVAAVKYAFANEWEDAHLLAKAHAPTRGFETGNDTERAWWHEQLATFAGRLAELPIVDCSKGMLPAIIQDDDDYADFIVPRLLTESPGNETTVERMWPLVEATSKLLPPRKELAMAWSDIANGWDSLGLAINRIAVEDLPRWARDGAETLDDLNVDGDAEQWIALFLDVTGECWKSRSGVDLTVLHDILPDQNRRLRSPSELSRDNGIPDSLKDICADLGLDIRRRLILAELYDVAAQNELPHLRYVLENALSNTISEDEVIRRAVESLVRLLPEDEECEEATLQIQHGSVRLLSYLWYSKQEQAVSTARQIPLITYGQRSVRWGPRRMMMAPVQCWHASAQPFAKAYPPNRILADMYAGSSSEDLPDCVAALVAWGIAVADPIHTDTPAALTPQRLTELSSFDTEGVSVLNNEVEFSQIALLQPEVLNRCREGLEEARALLGLVLCHVAPHDPDWTERQSVRGRISGQETAISVASALWLADLRIRPWVPIPGEDGGLTPMPANSKTLNELLNPKWLEDNDAAIRLLSEWFEFDQLELRLLGIEPDNERRERLRDGLASLVQLGGADPEIYLSLAAGMKEQKRRSRDINRFRCMGIGVQEAIKSAFEAQQLDPELVLDLELIDHGFDYEVNVLDNLSTRLPVGQYLLEIKATTTGRPHLSPLQAETASKRPDNYLLCVVDLRSLRHEDLPGEWPASFVEPLAKIVTDIGSRVKPTYSLVEEATNNSIAVRNESALRYAVPNEVWEAGISISDWVAALPHQ